MSGPSFKGRLGMGLWFYPRGGSSQVARYLSSQLARSGWDVALAAGSLGRPGDATHAGTFFTDVDLHAADYTAAVEAHRMGEDPLAAMVPLHASYEDRGDVPDRFLAVVEPALAEHLAASWTRILPSDFVERSDVFHLHHLTPIHEALTRLRPDAPVVTQLHGTELKFLAAAAERTRAAAAPCSDRTDARPPHHVALGSGSSVREARPDVVPTDASWRWPHAPFWVDRLQRIAARCQRVIVTSPSDVEAATSLLGIEAARIECIPNGVDTDLFHPRALSLGQRLGLLRSWLVEDPRGWDETGVPGTIRYSDFDLERIVDPTTSDLRPLLLYAGRFTAVKRVPMLLRAYARARRHLVNRPTAMLVWGGHPGELEGEHPRSVAARLGLDDVFFVGWRGHADLALAMAAADLVVLPSVNESFGQCAVEGMACGLPVVATSSGGPPSFINTEPGRPTGWLVEPDDQVGLAEALVDAVSRPGERRRRGERSLAVARTQFSWTSLVPRFEAIYDDLRSQRPSGSAE